jgi:hypothetical protein
MLMRLALYGSVAVLALAVLGARVPSHPEARGLAVEAIMLHGRTDQGGGAHVVVDEAVVIRILLTWRMSCDRPGPDPFAHGTFGAFEGDVIEQDGHRFSFEGTRDEHRVDGVTVRYDTDVSGTVSGTTVVGRGRMDTTWIVDGREVNRCESGEAHWRAGHGPPGGTTES